MAGAYQLQKELFQDDPGGELFQGGRAQDDPGGELFQGGRAQDDPEEIFDHIDGEPTVGRAPREGRSRYAGTHAKEKDVIMFSTGRKICLVGTPFIPFVKCTCELPPRLFPPKKDKS